jgi:predicted transcriptional regulator
MKRTTIFVDPALEKHVQAIAERRKVTFASVVREALAAYVSSQEGATQLSFVGAGASGHRDTAERHEELLWSQPHSRRPLTHPRTAKRHKARVLKTGSRSR